MSSTDTQSGLPVTIYTRASEIEPAVFLLAAIDCQAKGIDKALLLLEVGSGKLILQAECGCAVEVSLSQMVVNLGALIATKHLAANAAAMH